MRCNCVITDLRSERNSEGLRETLVSQEFSRDFLILGHEEVKRFLAEDAACVLIVHADQFSVELQLLFDNYLRLQGPVTRLVAIVADAPSPDLVAGAFEYGVDQFLSRKTWPKTADALFRQALRFIEEEASECLVIRTMKSIYRSHQKNLRQLYKATRTYMHFDYLAAYGVAKNCEAMGEFSMATRAYDVSIKIYPHFRPGVMGLAENLLILGNEAPAIAMLLELEDSFSLEVGRKSLLVSGYLGQGNMTKAEEYLKEAQQAFAHHPRVIEAQVQVLLAKQRLNDAFQLLDQISDAGPLFASKLNEVGIQLSQQKKGKSAMALYRKAHEIVRPELQYKISLNAALAAFRAGKLREALNLANRTQAEFGTSFEKLEKIKSVIQRKLGEANGGAA